jgi:hypothetical protein
MSDKSIINGKVCVLDHELEIVIGLVEFVPEEQIRLRKLEVLQLQTLHDGITKNIGSSKEPATTASLLVGYGSGFEVQGMTKDMLVSNIGGTGNKSGADIRMKENCSS